MTRIDYKKCAELLSGNDNYLILTHRNPDGDTLGSAFALHRALSAAGKKSTVRCIDEIHSKYEYLWKGAERGDIDFEKINAVDIADRKLLGEEFDKMYGDNVFICI
ncbi:MAG: bifunctional oligoribonuclease/PAP phosphatase NrnA, partial [Candidatus Fimenecus sp.]